MKHQLHGPTDECRICGLSAEDIMRLAFTKPRCEGKPDLVGRFLGREARRGR